MSQRTAIASVKIILPEATVLNYSSSNLITMGTVKEICIKASDGLKIPQQALGTSQLEKPGSEVKIDSHRCTLLMVSVVLYF